MFILATGISPQGKARSVRRAANRFDISITTTPPLTITKNIINNKNNNNINTIIIDINNINNIISPSLSHRQQQQNDSSCSIAGCCSDLVLLLFRCDQVDLSRVLAGQRSSV